MTDIRKWDIRGGIAPKPTNIRAKSRNLQSGDDDRSVHYPSSRARENIIPGPDELSRLIDRALNALSRGIYWDRGSIINMVL